MYTLAKSIFQIVVFLFFYTSVSANNKPHVINIYKEQYNADNKNWSIGQDELGTMYFGNDAGLLEFNGIEWRLNKLPNGQIVRSVAALSHQTVFTGSYEGFGRWDRDITGQLVYTSLSSFQDSKLLNSSDFWKVLIDGDVVYFQSFSSIFVYDYKEVKSVYMKDGLLFLSKVRNDFYIQQMQGPLYRVDEGIPMKIKGSDFLSGTDARVILPFDDDKCLIGTTTKGFYIYDGETFKEWNSSLSSFFNTKDLNCGILTSRGTYLFGTILDGLYEVDKKGKILNHISTGNGLQNNTVLNLYEDSLHNVWVALDRGIACVQYVDNLSYYTLPNGDIGAVYDAVIWENKLYLGTNQGVFYIDKQDLSLFDALKNLKLVNGTQGQVWSFKVIDGRLFCCHNKGVKEIHKDQHVKEMYSERGVYELIESTINSENVWILSTYTGFVVIDIKTKAVHILNDISEPIKSAEVDHLNNIWLEHANRGVYRCRLNHNMNFFSQVSYYGGNSEDGFPYKLKIFKVGGRIFLYGDDKFFTYDDIEDKIVSNKYLNESFSRLKTIKRIIPIGKDLFWALTKSSIHKFTYDGYKMKFLESYDLGMNLSLVSMYENISVLNDSLSLVCLDNGFSLYQKSDSDSSAIQKYLTPPYFESLEINNDKKESMYIDISEKNKIPYNYNSITFHFLTNNSFTSNLSFQFKLEPINEEWSTPGKVNAVHYPRLSVGHYTILVRAVDEMGNVSEEMSYSFSILPPWYQTWRAYLGYVAMFMIFFYLIWWVILRRYRNVHLQKIRTRETKRLRMLTDELQRTVDQKNAELLTQTSFIIHKNELILKIKSIIEDFYEKNKTQSLAPLYQKINVILNNNLDTEDDWKTFLFSFEQKHAGFFKKMKTLYPDLTTSDLRLCACLKLNLETKDIASLMSLTIRAVENNRYRLRKKLNLDPSQKLSEFFLEVD